MACVCSECGVTVDCGDTICPRCEINGQNRTTGLEIECGINPHVEGV